MSIDFGIMEKASNVYVLPADIGWSDLGTWDSLYWVGLRDTQNNVTDDNILYDTQECIIKSPQELLVLMQGLDGYIVAEYDNVFLICKRSEEQRVKEFVSDVRRSKENSYY